MPIKFEIPIRTLGGLNAREHWRARAKRVQAERANACMFTATGIWPNKTKNRIPSHIKLTRKYCGRKPDSDGFIGALKAVRDGIADALGFDDGDERCQWLYEQVKVAKRADFGVLVEIRYVD